MASKSVVALAWAAVAPLTGCRQGTPGFSIVKLDPALDAIVSSDGTLETIGDRFGLTEGPLWIQDSASGHLLFSDLISNVIYKWTPDGQLSVFLENVYDGPTSSRSDSRRGEGG
jgi:hypothetical protein